MPASEVRSILVPVDFSNCSKRALERAVSLADQYFEAEVDVLHVWDSSAARRPTKSFSKVDEEVLALRAMEKFLEDVAHKGSVKVQRIHAFGEPVAKIIETAATRPYDLIVMGTRGERKDDPERIGSVAAKVVGSAPCPVLTYREPSEVKP